MTIRATRLGKQEHAAHRLVVERAGVTAHVLIVGGATRHDRALERGDRTRQVVGGDRLRIARKCLCEVRGVLGDLGQIGGDLVARTPELLRIGQRARDLFLQRRRAPVPEQRGDKPHVPERRGVAARDVRSGAPVRSASAADADRQRKPVGEPYTSL
jgi:hypothetical protein